MSSFWDLVVGVVSVLATAYCLGLLCVHFMRRKSDKVSKIVLTLSYTGLVCMFVAPASICLTYFQPRLGSLELSSCYCSELWSISLVGYVISLYALKGIYLAQTRILNETGLFTGEARAAMAVNIVSASMCATAIVCLFMVAFRSGGTCHSDAEANGCLLTFDLSVLYIAITMIGLDFTLFAWFCHTVSVKPFRVVFMETSVALASCVADSVFQIFWYKPDGSGYSYCMTAYCLDIMVIATCISLCCRSLSGENNVARQTTAKQPPTMRVPSVTGSRQIEATSLSGMQTSYSVDPSMQRNEDVSISMPPGGELLVKKTDAEAMATSMAFAGLI